MSFLGRIKKPTASSFGCRHHRDWPIEIAGSLSNLPPNGDPSSTTHSTTRSCCTTPPSPSLQTDTPTSHNENAEFPSTYHSDPTAFPPNSMAEGYFDVFFRVEKKLGRGSVFWSLRRQKTRSRSIPYLSLTNFKRGKAFGKIASSEYCCVSGGSLDDFIERRIRGFSKGKGLNGNGNRARGALNRGRGRGRPSGETETETKAEGEGQGQGDGDGEAEAEGELERQKLIKHAFGARARKQRERERDREGGAYTQRQKPYPESSSLSPHYTNSSTPNSSRRKAKPKPSLHNPKLKTTTTHTRPRPFKNSLFSDIVSDLDFLHSRNVLHLDMKPGNVLLRFDHGYGYGYGEGGLPPGMSSRSRTFSFAQRQTPTRG
ncbi:hypothetical protein D9758_012659 [Tetrapyrgos nigripes]|uniref:Protein kinase domain-containing protein n=1 Tax=Tetrapyrgos nigripes TaxID=182062 RepID=A0A8H5GDL2_9AGAR|nr:hypothetical protein D9758_012659 [Tetrapyrgos nigripes]